MQWWQVTPTGDIQQLGRIENPTGQVHYAFPSIAVNRCNDVLVGFNSFSTNQYVSAEYVFRYATDPPGMVQSNVVLKAGLDLVNGGWGRYRPGIRR